MRRKLLFAVGCVLLFASCQPAAPPLPAPAPPPPAPPPPPAEYPINVCVVDGAELIVVQAYYRPISGDTVVVADGVPRPIEDAYPPTRGYAVGKPWYGSGPIRIDGRSYARYGGLRFIEPWQLTRIAVRDSVPFFVEEGSESRDVVYVPHAPACVFQPYARAPEGSR